MLKPGEISRGLVVPLVSEVLLGNQRHVQLYHWFPWYGTQTGLNQLS